MAVTNHERVGKALTLVRDSVRPEVEQIWRGRYGMRWMQRVNDRLHHQDRVASPDDLAFLLKGMDATWDQFFRDTLSRSTRSYLHPAVGCAQPVGAQPAVQFGGDAAHPRPLRDDAAGVPGR